MHSPFPGLFACRDCWKTSDPVTRNTQLVQAAARLHPQWIFNATTAATLLGINSAYSLQRGLHIATDEGSRSRFGPHVHQHFFAEKDHDQLVMHAGIRITSPLRTVFDCARYLDFTDSLPIIDAALRARLVTLPELLEFCRKLRGYQGRAKAEIAISYGSPLSENGGESAMRAQLIQLGCESPEQQVIFNDPINHHDYRVDFLWRDSADHIVIGEFHGRAKYVDPSMTDGKSATEVLAAEMKRASRLSLQDIRLVDLDYRDMWNLRMLRDIIIEYGIPLRASYRPHHLEFNPQLTISEVGYSTLRHR